MVRKEPGEDAEAEAEAAQEAACPLSLGPRNEGLLPKVLVTWCYKHLGCARQLSSASSQHRTHQRRQDRALDWRNETEEGGGCHSDGSWIEALSPQRHTKMGNWLHLWKLVHSPKWEPDHQVLLNRLLLLLLLSHFSRIRLCATP